MIVEMSSEELSSLAATSDFSGIEVKDKDNAIVKRDAFYKLEAGDFIDPSVFNEHNHKISELKNAKSDISKSAATLRGSLTKLLNVIPDGGEE